MSRRAGFAALGSLSALLLTKPLWAQATGGVELRWEAPLNCPRESDVRERIQALVGSPKPTDNRLSVDGAITQTEDGRFRLKLGLRVSDLVGERVLDSKSCKDLAGAAAVAVALLMRSPEPLSEHDLSEPAISVGNRATPTNHQESASEAAAQRNTAKPAPSAPQPIEASPRSWRALVQAPNAVLGIGPLPEPSFGLALGAGFSIARWRFSLQLTDWLRQDLRSLTYPDFRAQVRRQTASIWTCRALRLTSFELAPCFTLSVQHLSARGDGDHIQPRSQEAAWLAPGIGGRARVQLAPWFSVVAAVNGEVELARPQISIDGLYGIGGTGGTDDIARLAPGAVSIMLGSEWIL